LPGSPRIRKLASDAELREVDDPYLAFVDAQGVGPGDLSTCGLRVVFTPLHGVGHTSVVPVLRARGVDVVLVDAQLPDDGAFGTVASANPEAPEALALGRARAVALDADMVIATDPDADRIG